MSKVKYTNEILEQAVKLRLEGKSIPEITEATGMKSPSLKKLFRDRNIKLDPESKKKALERRWLDHQPIVDDMKLCSRCKRERPVTEFAKDNRKISKLASQCKECDHEYYQENAEHIKNRAKVYREANPEAKKESSAKYYKNNTDYFKDKAKEWQKANPEKTKQITNNYGKRNQKKKNARTAAYRAAKIQATPHWLTDQQKEEIRRIYENCPKGYHIDHIIPLNGVNVRGLHVPANLQYLPIVENLKKGNKF